jgi:N utilization substance protein A
VLVDDEAKQATVIVPDDQLSLAIGREGQNARLAARLTGWRVDIRSESEFAAEEAEHGYEEEEVQGRCAAILSNGRRCPNASLPGSRYCGLETHQALANIEGDQISDLAPAAGGDESPEPVEAPLEEQKTATGESEPTTLDDPAETTPALTAQESAGTLPDEGDATISEQQPAEVLAAQETTGEQTP